MKLLNQILVLTLMGIGCSAFAQIGQQLNCSGGNGGPAPATAMLSLEKAPAGNDQYVIQLQLVDRALPDGIVGAYDGTLTSDSFGQTLDATGKIGGFDSSIVIQINSAGNTSLVIYAEGNHLIEYGFGMHLLCK